MDKTNKIDNKKFDNRFKRIVVLNEGSGLVIFQCKLNLN